jgi:hypothetical protein
VSSSQHVLHQQSWDVEEIVLALAAALTNRALTSVLGIVCYKAARTAKVGRTARRKPGGTRTAHSRKKQRRNTKQPEQRKSTTHGTRASKDPKGIQHRHQTDTSVSGTRPRDKRDKGKGAMPRHATEELWGQIARALYYISFSNTARTVQENPTKQC